MRKPVLNAMRRTQCFGAPVILGLPLAAHAEAQPATPAANATMADRPS
jgi:hypothetical protein